MTLIQKVKSEMLIETKPKAKKVVEHIFRVKENKGGLPYTLMWIGKHKLPTINHFTYLLDALQAKNNLEVFGIKPSLLIDYEHCKMSDKKEKLLWKELNK